MRDGGRGKRPVPARAALASRPGRRPVLIAVMLFGSLSIFATATLGEYLTKVFEKVKQRPLFIRRSIILDGDVRMAADESIPGTGE